MTRSATFGSSALFYSAISRPGNSVNSAQIWSHSNVSSSSYLGSSPSFGSWTCSCNPCPLSISLSPVNLIRPLSFQVFCSFLRWKTENLFDLNNNHQDPVRILLKLSTFCFYLPPNLRSLTSSNMDSLLYFLYYSLYLLLLFCPSLLTLYVHVRASGQSVSPDTLADVLDVNMFPPGRPDCGLPSLYFHQRFILMFCVPPSGSFQCSKMFPQHVPQALRCSLSLCFFMEDCKLFNRWSWMSQKAQEAMRLMMYCRCCCMFLIVFL